MPAQRDQGISAARRSDWGLAGPPMPLPRGPRDEHGDGVSVKGIGKDARNGASLEPQRRRGVHSKQQQLDADEREVPAIGGQDEPGQPCHGEERGNDERDLQTRSSLHRIWFTGGAVNLEIAQIINHVSESGDADEGDYKGEDIQQSAAERDGSGASGQQVVGEAKYRGRLVVPPFFGLQNFAGC